MRLARAEHDTERQHQDPAEGSHQVDHGVRLRAQRFDRDVRHQRDRRRTEDAHRNERDEQHRHEQHEDHAVLRRGLCGIRLTCGHEIGIPLGGCILVALRGALCDFGHLRFGILLGKHVFLALMCLQRSACDPGFGINGMNARFGHLRRIADLCELCVVDERQAHECGDRNDRADHDVRRALTEARLALIGQRAEDRQHEQREHVIECHNDARPALRHAELIGQDLGDDIVVCLPERADEKESKTDADRALIVQFHRTLRPKKRR